MEFWGVEVKSGAPLNVQPGEGMVIHLSQASIGEVKVNKSEIVSLFVIVDGKKLVLGTLLSDKLPQQQFDLVFDRDFELSHNSKSGSIYFFGYKAANPVEEEEGFESDDSEEEDITLMANNDIKAKQEKPVVVANAKESTDVAAAAAAAGKQKVKIVEPTKAVKPEDDDDSEDDDYDEDATSDEDVMDEDDESDSEDDDSEEDDETLKPKKETSGKKRDAESAIKTPAPEKKTKLVTPQKTDGKKSGHVATPHPSKKAGKPPANNGSQQQTPKSAGSHSCSSCNKTFGSENALQSHTKAKHSAGK